MRLAGKLVLIFVAVIIAVLAIDTFVLLRNRVQLLESGVQVDVQQLGRVVRDCLASAPDQAQLHPSQWISRLSRSNEGIRLRWVEPNPADHSLTGLNPGLADLGRLRHGEDIIDKTPTARGNHRVVAYVPVLRDGELAGAIEVSHSLVALDRYSEAVRLRGIWLSGIMIVAGAGAAGIVGFFLVARPLQRLIAHTRRIGEGDLSQQPESPQRDELGELSRAINRMCHHLREARLHIEAETAARIATIEQLRHADRLTTVGRLAAGVAHEMGTPLNVISGRASMLAEDPALPREAGDAARVIHRQADRITRVIRGLLDLSRRTVPEKQRADLYALFVETAELLGSTARHVGVHVQLLPAAPLWASVDRGQMQQVFTKLLINAIQAMPSGGQIQVRFENCRAATPDSGGTERYCCRIDIEDQGVGIDPDHQPHIFEPFFTTKDIGQGTGLGLSIAYGIVREHDGWIDVRSTPGKGSVFSVFLPSEKS